MAIALLTHASAAGSAGGAITPSIDTTGAKLIVACIDGFTGGGDSFTDSKSNTWVGLTYTNTGTVGTRIYYCTNPSSVGSGHTFTTNAAFSSICVACFSGVLTASSPFDQQNTHSATSGSTIASGSVTPTQDNELLIAAFGGDATGTNSINGGFTITDQRPFIGGTCYGCSLAYLIQTSAAAANPTWTLGSAITQGGAAIASFKAPAAAFKLIPPMMFQGAV